LSQGLFRVGLSNHSGNAARYSGNKKKTRVPISLFNPVILGGRLLIH
jgi:hypothetical protein